MVGVSRYSARERCVFSILLARSTDNPRRPVASVYGFVRSDVGYGTNYRICRSRRSEFKNI